MACVVFPAVVDQSCLVSGQVRPQFGQPLTNLLDRRLAGIPLPQSLREYRLRRESYSERCWLRTGCRARPSTSRDSGAASVLTAGVRNPRHEEVDEAFSDSFKAPCDVIPIQDVLLVSVEQFAHQRPHAVLTIGDKVLSALS